MRGVFVDANESLAVIFERLQKPGDPEVRINRDPDISPEQYPEILDGAEIAIVDHTALPTDIAKKCAGLKHVVFLGTGARSYMNPEELAETGIHVHLIKGYGDTAVAECAIALMWEGARGLAKMDRGIRAGNWLRDDGMQLTGKTLGLIGFGGIAAEVARIALGSGMRVIAWNRSPKKYPKVEFVDYDELLTESDVISMHLLLNDETRGLISRACIEAMKPGVILVNTARGAIVDEEAMIEALKSGQIRHAGLDVFNIEPLPADHPLTKLRNVTLSAHSAFRTPEASENLIERRCSIAGGLRRGSDVGAALRLSPCGRAVSTHALGSRRVRSLRPRRRDCSRIEPPHRPTLRRTFSHKGRRKEHASIHHLRHRLAAGGRVGVAAEIPRAQRAFAERALDRADDRCRGVLLAEMLQHHRAGPDHADRIGDALPRDIGRRAVHRLEHRREIAVRIDVARRRDADGAGAGRAEIGEDVAEQIGADHDVEPVRMQHEIRGEDVDVVLVPLHLRDSSSPSPPRARPNTAW